MTDNQLMGPEDRLASQSGVPQGANMRALSMAQVRDVGQVMAMSGMFPDINKDGAKAFVKILAGQEMGIPPFEAMGGISIISGKATIGGNIMAAKVKGSGKYDYKIKSRTNDGCSIEFFEKNGDKWESLGVETFDKTDATAAGLAGKDMWKKYPKNMYFNRAISNGVRTYCPDVLGAGPVYTPEEMGAQVDEDGNALIAPGMTYRQDDDTPANVLPAIAPPVTSDEEPADKPIKREGNPLQLISEDLLERGIVDKTSRGAVALRVAQVSEFGELSTNQWFEVYDLITSMDDDALFSFIPTDDEEQEDNTPPPAQPDDVAEVTDETIAAAENGTLLDGVAEAFGTDVAASAEPVPESKKAAAKKPSGAQIAKLNSLYVKARLKGDKQKENFNMATIGKNFPLTAEDYETLIAELKGANDAPTS